MKTPTLQWQTPEPLWTRFGPDMQTAARAEDQHRPAILRFASDAFMDQMLATLDRDPSALAGLLARPETWRSPPAPTEAAESATDAGASRDARAPTGADLIDRIPLPRAARAAARGLARRRAKSRVAPVPASQSVREKTQVRTLPLKLFQPAHQRYYLLSASLVCRQAGMPDRALTRGGDQVGFVLRRLLPPTSGADGTAAAGGTTHEHAFVPGPSGARWQRVSAHDDDAVLCPGEEILPLFPLTFTDAAGHARTLWSGLIPVGRREEYLGAVIEPRVTTLTEARLEALAPATTPPAASSTRARLAQFQTEVAEPWKNLIRAVYRAREVLHESHDSKVDDEDEEAFRKKLWEDLWGLNLQWQMQSWLILLDLADYLKLHLPGLWQAIADNGASAAALGTAATSSAAQLYQWLGQADNSPELFAVIGESPTKHPGGQWHSLKRKASFT